jgi:peptidylprolyl isomerase
MLKADDGDVVRVHYVLSLKDGSVYDSSVEQLPFEFMIGRGAVLPALEHALVGMREGETKEFAVPPEKAYGCYLEDLVQVIERTALPPDLTPEIGMTLQFQTHNGREIDARVTEVDDATIKVDANHEFAGKELNFRISLLKIIRPG